MKVVALAALLLMHACAQEPSTRRNRTYIGKKVGEPSPSETPEEKPSPLKQPGQYTPSNEDNGGQGEEEVDDQVVADAASLLKITENCTPVAGVGKFSEDHKGVKDIPMCQLDGAIFWVADMDVDCDGGSSAECKGDPYYQSTTSGRDSKGRFVDASTIPFIVAPLNSQGYDFAGSGMSLGSVAAVIYNGQLIYAPIADRGPKGVIGEGSAALNKAFGVSGHPIKGGINGKKVTYIIFTGSSGIVKPIESKEKAKEVGEARALELLSKSR